MGNLKPPPDKIRCPRCDLWLNPDRFYKSKGRRPYGLSSRFKKCERGRLDAIPKKERTTDELRQIYAEHNMKRKFGLSWDDYLAMVERADGVCEICGKAETQVHHATGQAQRLSVDHDSETGLIRGILCSRCNRGIGFLQHDPDLLAAAIAYLATH